MRKKVFLLLIGISILLLAIPNCQCSSINKSNFPTPIKKVKNSTTITIGYVTSNYIAIITNKKEIKQLEDLVNNATFIKNSTQMQVPFLTIDYYGKKSSISFNIDNNDVIKLRDGHCVKSKQVKFKKLYSIFNDYMHKNKNNSPIKWTK